MDASEEEAREIRLLRAGGMLPGSPSTAISSPIRSSSKSSRRRGVSVFFPSFSSTFRNIPVLLGGMFRGAGDRGRTRAGVSGTGNLSPTRRAGTAQEAEVDTITTTTTTTATTTARTTTNSPPPARREIQQEAGVVDTELGLFPELTGGARGTEGEMPREAGVLGEEGMGIEIGMNASGDVDGDIEEGRRMTPPVQVCPEEPKEALSPSLPTTRGRIAYFPDKTCPSNCETGDFFNLCGGGGHVEVGNAQEQGWQGDGDNDGMLLSTFEELGQGGGGRDDMTDPRINSGSCCSSSTTSGGGGPHPIVASQSSNTNTDNTTPSGSSDASSGIGFRFRGPFGASWASGNSGTSGTSGKRAGKRGRGKRPSRLSVISNYDYYYSRNVRNRNDNEDENENDFRGGGDSVSTTAAATTAAAVGFSANRVSHKSGRSSPGVAAAALASAGNTVSTSGSRYFASSSSYSTPGRQNNPACAASSSASAGQYGGAIENTATTMGRTMDLTTSYWRNSSGGTNSTNSGMHCARERDHGEFSVENALHSRAASFREPGGGVRGGGGRGGSSGGSGGRGAQGGGGGGERGGVWIENPMIGGGGWGGDGGAI